MKKRIAKRKTSSRHGKTSIKPVRKKTTKQRNPRSSMRALKATSKAETSKNLFYFDVDEHGTIRVSDFKAPKINREVFDNISINRLTTPENIINEVEYYDALVWYFRSLADHEHEKLIRRIELQDYRDDKELQRMRLLAKALEDGDDGWKEWINIEGNEGAARFKKVIVDWLAAPIEWEEDMPDNATAMGSAQSFFKNEDLTTRVKLGVRIIEGEFPGSTYYAVELHKKVEEANEIAQKLGLSYRFRDDKKSK